MYPHILRTYDWVTALNFMRPELTKTTNGPDRSTQGYNKYTSCDIDETN